MLKRIIQPKRPKANTGWVQVPFPKELLDPLLQVDPPDVWEHPDGFCVWSAVEKPTPLPGESDVGPEYHLSISRNGGRCTLADAMWILGQFDLVDAKEDNHVPYGFVRNFWRPVADHLSGFECPCQDSEPAMREDKGDFVWRGVPR